MHLPILCGTAKPAVKRCTTCCKLFHCPLCPKSKPCAPSRLEKHLEVHAICIPVWKPGHFLLADALYTILDAPYDFTIIDMPALRKWWCVMLMENFDLGRLDLLPSDRLFLRAFVLHCSGAGIPFESL
ncbi:pH-response transcription factor pacC/RIM101 [Dissostichus eleginoides]|uniref:PH-response transcription factor pacC/RIM101 n=1 Tax=Dissostichus eleginoides TaxID=100907 RepID=A0AAD9BB27_DISEL|nr:pH-response transcription factor pacC/RIM101 [Dissostichus eleginoides]